MTEIIKLYRGVTDVQKKSAEKVAVILRSRGFEADDLDDVVLRVAERLGESAGRVGFDTDTQVDAELVAADGINMTSIDSQLQLLSAFHRTEKDFFRAIEAALSISLTSSGRPLA